MLIAAAGRGRCGSSSGPTTASASTSDPSTRTRPSSKRTAGWRPAVTLRAGLADTLDYYREHMDRYIDGRRRRTDVVTMRVPFMSLGPGPDAPDVRAAIDRVIARGWFILGPEVEAFERNSRRPAARGMPSASARARMPWRWPFVAWASGPGDEVITSPLSAAFSALAIRMAEATPVFVDVDPHRLTVDPAAVEAAITAAACPDAGSPLRTSRGHAGAAGDRDPPSLWR